MRENIFIKAISLIIIILFPTVIYSSTPPDAAKKTEILTKTYRMQIPFIENKGQMENGDLSFYATTFGGTVFVGKDGTLTYSLPAKDKGGVVIKEVPTDKKVKVTGLEPSPTKVNYFIGNDQSKWRSNVPSYESVSLGEVYKGVELILKAYGKSVEKIYTVLPKANPETINIKLQGAKDLKVNDKGELEVLTDHGPLTFTKPIAYQEIDRKRVAVNVSYRLTNVKCQNPNSKYINSPIPESLHPLIQNIQHPASSIQYLAFYTPEPSTLCYGFKVDSYNKDYPLIIDPLLASTFIGGSDHDYDSAIALNGSGNVYMAGLTYSSDYPTTPDAYDISFNVGEVFISKFDSSLNTLLASTFIGGSNDEGGYSLALDGSGNVYVTGRTVSTDYPTTSGAYDTSYNGGDYDVFVSKLDSNLSTLLASTFIGGSGNEGYSGTFVSLALDGSKNIYITGLTMSTDYPTTPGAYDTSHNSPGDYDVFVSKLNSNLSTLLASTFIGSNGGEEAHSLALDGSGNVYVNGITVSSNYPTTPGAYDTSYNGGAYDAFVSKFDNNLSILLASTFIGGNGNDWVCGNSLFLDGSGNVFVTGGTTSSDFPTTPGAYDTSYNGGISNGDAFISKLDSNLSSLLASTFIGGSGEDIGIYLTLDGSGNVFVTGVAQSGYPTTTGAYDTSYNGGSYDVFVSKFDNPLSTLLASTFIGGSDAEYSTSLAFDTSGNVYLLGHTWSTDYPTTPGVYDTSFNSPSYADVFISKLDKNLLAGPTFRSGLHEEEGFTRVISAKERNFSDGITYLDDPFAIIQCKHYDTTIDFWFTDWDNPNNVKSIDYYFTWDTDFFDVESVTYTGSDWDTHSETLVAPGKYKLTLGANIPGVPGPDIKLHTITLHIKTAPATGWVKAELLPDGVLKDINNTQYHEIGRTEITIKTICDVTSSTSCTEITPCDILSTDELCPISASVTEDNYTWEPLESGTTNLCGGKSIKIFHTKTGSYVTEDSCMEDICESPCFNNCLDNCRRIPLNQCYVRCIGGCINGICPAWTEETCYNFSRIADCNETCYYDCDHQGETCYYNRHCGFSFDETIAMKVPDGYGGCTGVEKDERSMIGKGTTWMSMALPLQAGAYDLCKGTTFIGTVAVGGEGCSNAACKLSIPSNIFLVNHGVSSSLEVALSNLNKGGTYTLSLQRWEDDAHTIPLSYPSYLQLDPTQVSVGTNGTATFRVRAIIPQPVSGQTHWANIIIRATSGSCSCEGSFDFDIFSDNDGDGIPYSEDNCPNTPNGPALGTCYSWSGMAGTCTSDTDCGGSHGSCSKNQEDTFPPQGNGIGDACDCEGNFDCDRDVDASDVTAFITHFGRNAYSNPCTAGNPCNGDFECDRDVDSADVTKFLEDSGRNAYNNPCPVCVAGNWCVYP